MIATIRFTLGVNRALFDIQDRGLIDPARREKMVSIVSGDINRLFGVQMLKTGAARTKEAAAAAVFARLAGAAETTPEANNGITAHDWRAAARQALVNGGAGEMQSHLLVATLIEDVRL